MHGMMHGWMDGGMPMGAFGWIFMLLWWGFVILGVVAAVRWVLSRTVEPRGAEGTESPLDILKKRYARGEISKKQFEQMRQDLE